MGRPYSLRSIVMAQQTVQIHVMALAVALQKFSVHTFALKAQLFIQRDRPFVVAEHRQLY